MTTERLVKSKIRSEKSLENLFCHLFYLKTLKDFSSFNDFNVFSMIDKFLELIILNCYESIKIDKICQTTS